MNCIHILIIGQYHVILDEPHFKDLLNIHVTPAPATVSKNVN